MAQNGFISRDWAACPSSLLEAAKQADPKQLLVIGAGAALPMQSAFEAFQAGIASPLLVGERDAINAQAEQLGWSLPDEMIIDAKGEAGAAETAAEYLRQDIAGAGQIGAVMKGQLHTDIFMGALLDKTVGVRTGNRLVHIFAIFPPDGGVPVMVSDAAVNVSPDLKTKAQSLIQMTMMGKALGISRPKLDKRLCLCIS